MVIVYQQIKSTARENRMHGSEGGEVNSLPYPYHLGLTYKVVSTIL